MPDTHANTHLNLLNLHPRNRHNKQAWATTSLRAVAMDLASMGYVCYFDGQPTLTRITGCWDDSLELKAWSNVVCAPVGTRQLAMLESLSWLAGTRKGL